MLQLAKHDRNKTEKIISADIASRKTAVNHGTVEPVAKAFLARSKRKVPSHSESARNNFINGDFLCGV